MFISRKDYEALQEASQSLLEELEKLKKRPFLIGIERKGRENLFTFVRDGEVYQVRTMGLISDNLPEWKEKLLHVRKETD